VSKAIEELKSYTDPMQAALAGLIGRPPTVEIAQAIIELDERLRAIEQLLEACVDLDHRGNPCGSRVHDD
jgi:hypothetical protein